jgi:hypothetical protein
MVEKIEKYFKALVFDWRLRRAIRKAKRDAALYGKKFLVLAWGGKPVVVSMQGVKRLIRQRRFAKGFTAEKAAELALYIAYPNAKK